MEESVLCRPAPGCDTKWLPVEFLTRSLFTSGIKLGEQSRLPALLGVLVFQIPITMVLLALFTAVPGLV